MVSEPERRRWAATGRAGGGCRFRFRRRSILMTTTTMTLLTLLLLIASHLAVAASSRASAPTSSFAASSAVFPAPAPSSSSNGFNAPAKNPLCPLPTPVRVVGASVASVRAALLRREFSCLDLVESYARRTAALDGSSRGPLSLGAVRGGRVLESAFEEARAVDALIAEKLGEEERRQRRLGRRRRQLLLLPSQEGNNLSPSLSPSSSLPPLLCVPFLIKDNIDVQGTPTTAGSVALLSALESSDRGAAARNGSGSGNRGHHGDAAVVASLRRAGAVILAKSNMAEWALSPVSSFSSVAAMDELERERRRGAAAPAAAAPALSSPLSHSPRRSHLGAVRNPYDLSRSPAGSSGGSAAGVAASLALAALGTDTGNSVRGPAAAVGIVGFRPSLGLISREGVVPLDSTSDTVGPLARSVADAAAVFDALVAGTAAEEEERKRRKGERSSSPLEKNRDFSTYWSAVPPSARLPGIHAAAAERGSSSGGLKGIRLGVLDCALSLAPESSGADDDDKSDEKASSEEKSRLAVLRLFNSSMLALERAGATVVRGFRVRGNALGDEEWNCLPGVWPTKQDGKRRLEPLACRGRFAADAEPYLSSLLSDDGEKKGKDEEEDGGFVRSVWEAGGQLHRAAAAPLRSHFDDGAGGEIPRPLRLLPQREKDPGVCGCGALWAEEEGGKGGTASARADPCRVEFRRRLVESMDSSKVDAVALPTWTLPPRLLSEDDDFSDAEVEEAVVPSLSPSLSPPPSPSLLLLPGVGGGQASAVRARALSLPLPSVVESGNLSPLLSPPTGAPGVSLPMGFSLVGGSSDTSSSSSSSRPPPLFLPAGLQLVGRPFADAELVRVAAAVERALLEADKVEDERDGRRGEGGGGRGRLGLPPPLFGECG